MNHLVRIEYAPLSVLELRWLDWFGRCCSLSPLGGGWSRVPIVGLVGLEEKESLEHGLRRIETLVSVRLGDGVSRFLPVMHYAFRLHDSGGGVYLLGVPGGVAPLVRETETRPDVVSDRAVRTLTISYPKPLLTIIE